MTETESRTTTCGTCGRETIGPEAEPGTPCPGCGSTLRHTEMTLQETVEIHESTRLLQRDSKGKKLIQHEQGDSLTRSTGRFALLSRTIDWVRRRYREKITDPQTGKVFRDVDERLEDHQGRGNVV